MRNTPHELADLVVQAQTGCLDAFEAIVKRLQNMAAGYAYGILGDFHLAQDAAQEAFMTAFRDLPSLREPAAFSAWLRRLILKHCDRFTRGMHPQTVPLDSSLHLVSDDKTPAQILLAQETRNRVLASVHALPVNERVAVTLFYLDEYSQKQLARFLEVPESTINGRLQTARKRLRHTLGSDTVGEGMQPIMKETLMPNLPSNDDQFAHRIQLFNAVEAGQTEKSLALLKLDPELVYATDIHQQTPLHRAAYRGHREVVTMLLERGADPNASDIRGQTPLHHLAMLSTMSDIAEILIAAGANVHATDSNGSTPLFLAFSCNYHKLRGSGNAPREFWEMLIDHGAEMDVFAAAVYRANVLEALLEQDTTLAHARRGPEQWTPLHFVADLGYPGQDEILIKYGADVNAQDSKGHTPLQLATHRLATEIEYFFGGGWSWVAANLIEHGAGEDAFDSAALGRWERIRKLWKQDRSLVNGQNAGGNTPLHLAAWNGQRDAVQLFMAIAGIDLNARNNEGKTPIQMAAEDGHRTVAEMLLRRGVECDLFTAAATGMVHEVATQLRRDPSLAQATDDDGRSALRYASVRWRKEKCFWREWRYEQKEEALLAIINMLIESDATMDIWTAASLGLLDDIQEILKLQPALVDAFEEDFAPIHCAALMGQTDAVDLLLDFGASVHTRGPWTHTPLHMAAWAGQKETAQVLLRRGAPIEARTGQGLTPLHIAAYESQVGVGALLLENDADANTQQGEPLCWALWNNDAEFVRLLTRHGADVNLPRDDDRSLLRMAAPNTNQYEIAQHLLESGAQVDDTDELGRTPLHAAARSGNTQAVKLLLEHGANVNARDNDDSTSLHCAVLGKSTECIALLISHGAHPDARTEQGKTPLKWAQEGEFVAEMECLISHGADLNAANESGVTPLHSAARLGQESVVQRLVSHGADVNARDEQGKTPLKYAQENVARSAAERLMAHGADSEIANLDGLTPLHSAARLGQQEMVELLLTGGANAEARDKAGKTPLDWAIEKGHQPIVERLRASHG